MPDPTTPTPPPGLTEAERDRLAARLAEVERERDVLAGALRDLWAAAESSPELCNHPAVDRAEALLAAAPAEGRA